MSKVECIDPLEARKPGFVEFQPIPIKKIAVENRKNQREDICRETQQQHSEMTESY